MNFISRSPVCHKIYQTNVFSNNSTFWWKFQETFVIISNLGIPLEPQPPNRGLSAQHTTFTLFIFTLQLFIFILRLFIFILQSFIFILQLFISICILQSFIFILQLFIFILQLFICKYFNLFFTFFLEPRPPNRGLSAQAAHWPQSSRIQPSHSPHRRVLVALLELP